MATTIQLHYNYITNTLQLHTIHYINEKHDMNMEYRNTTTLQLLHTYITNTLQRHYNYIQHDTVKTKHDVKCEIHYYNCITTTLQIHYNYITTTLQLHTTIYIF